MTDITIFIFTQENCNPCYRLKDYIKTLPSEQQDALEILPLKTPTGNKTALASELNVELTPTLVVASESVVCDNPDEETARDCNLVAEPIETIVGATDITTALPGIFSNYICSND
tara:strand:+ start:422 stop:766 length:345 start_codon:yes stop_codon:yes gene_type:complete